MELVLSLLFMFVLLIFKGFFSGSEIALVNSDKIKLRHQAKTGHKGAAMAMDMLRNPEILLSTTLVGTNISSVILTTVGTLLMINLFGSLGDLYAILVFTPIFLIFGEIVPKSIYQQKSDDLTPVIIYPLRWASFVFTPVIFIFSRIARIAVRLVGGGDSNQTMFITREKLQALVELAEHSTAMSVFDRGQIKRVIRFADTTVAEAMIPIAEVTAIPNSQSTAEALQLVRKHGFNRLPVYERSTTDIIGLVTLTTWDLMDEWIMDKPLVDLVKSPLYVSPLQTIDQLMPILQKRTDRMAIVADEFGATVGIITMEDIVEEVVGEIDVGYDFEEYLPKRKRTVEDIGGGAYLFDARLPISEVNDILGTSLPSTEFHTVGGMVVARLKRIPEAGESVTVANYLFTVEDASERTILRVRVEPVT